MLGVVARIQNPQPDQSSKTRPLAAEAEWKMKRTRGSHDDVDPQVLETICIVCVEVWYNYEVWKIGVIFWFQLRFHFETYLHEKRSIISC